MAYHPLRSFFIVAAVAGAAALLGLLPWPACGPDSPRIEIGNMLVAGCR
jgi:hypothetical protein